MAHQRETIRAAVKAVLLTVPLVSVSGNVFIAQAVPLHASQLPAITIWTPGDKTREESVQSSPRELDQDLVLEVTAWVKDTGDDDEATANLLDDLLAEIETAMHADPQFKVATVASCGDSWLTGTAMDLAAEGENLMGRGVMEYGFLYRTSAPVAPTGLDDFDTGHTEIVLSDDANDAQNTFPTVAP